MQIINISDCLQKMAEETILGFTGIVDSIYEQNSGTSQHGDWSIQNMTIRDAHDPKVKIKAKIKDREAIPLNAKGKKITVCCTQGTKGWNGVKIKEDEYPKGKFSLILSITPTAEISFDGKAAEPAQPVSKPNPRDMRTESERAGVEDGQPHNPPANTPETASPKTTKEQMAQDVHAVRQKAVNRARAMTGRYANMYWICITGAEYIFKKYAEQFGEPMTADQFQSITSGMFIQSSRDGLIDDLPPGDLTPFLPAKQTDTKKTETKTETKNENEN